MFRHLWLIIFAQTVTVFALRSGFVVANPAGPDWLAMRPAATTTTTNGGTVTVVAGCLRRWVGWTWCIPPGSAIATRQKRRTQAVVSINTSKAADRPAQTIPGSASSSGSRAPKPQTGLGSGVICRPTATC